MHSEVQTAAVIIIRYKPLSDLSFARYSGYGSTVSMVVTSVPSSPLGSFLALATGMYKLFTAVILPIVRDYSVCPCMDTCTRTRISVN